MKIYEWLQSHGFATLKVETGRLKRGQELKLSRPSLGKIGSSEYAVELSKPYSTTWRFTASQPCKVELNCACPDWAERGHLNQQPCKHLWGLAIQGDLPVECESLTPSLIWEKSAQSEPEQASSLTFNEKVQRAIGFAIDTLAERILASLAVGQIPLLLGPTGCGKTSAVRQAALKMQAHFIESAGADSWTDSDLVGVEMPNGRRMPGPVSLALDNAREMGEPTVLFLDEFYRFPSRAQESLMRLLLPIPAEVVQIMGIGHDGPIRATSAPFWGETWAPAGLVHIVLAANPWGNVPDPALIRRIDPLEVEFASGVMQLFTGKARSAIEISWKGCADGSLPLPIEYGELSRAAAAEDSAFVTRYLSRVAAIDPAAAQGFKTLWQNIQ